MIDIWMPYFAAVCTEEKGNEWRDPLDIWMERLKVATPHLVVKLAKTKVQNVQDGFAREPVFVCLFAE